MKNRSKFLRLNSARRAPAQAQPTIAERALNPNHTRLQDLMAEVKATKGKK